MGRQSSGVLSSHARDPEDRSWCWAAASAASSPRTRAPKVAATPHRVILVDRERAVRVRAFAALAHGRAAALQDGSFAATGAAQTQRHRGGAAARSSGSMPPAASVTVGGREAVGRLPGRSPSARSFAPETDSRSRRRPATISTRCAGAEALRDALGTFTGRQARRAHGRARVQVPGGAVRGGDAARALLPQARTSATSTQLDLYAAEPGRWASPDPRCPAAVRAAASRPRESPTTRSTRCRTSMRGAARCASPTARRRTTISSRTSRPTARRGSCERLASWARAAGSP